MRVDCFRFYSLDCLKFCLNSIAALVAFFIPKKPGVGEASQENLWGL